MPCACSGQISLTNGFGTDTSTLIRVPNQTKRRPDVIPFKTTKERHIDGIVATLAELYKGDPVSSVRIGRSYGMGHHQVLIYLRMAERAGQATPVLSNAGGVTRGWVPANVEVKHTLAEQKAIRAAEAVKHLYSGEPVPLRFVARHLNKPKGTIARWLNAPKRMKLVRKPDSGMCWLP